MQNKNVYTTHDNILEIKDEVSPYIYVRPFYMRSLYLLLFLRAEIQILRCQ